MREADCGRYLPLLFVGLVACESPAATKSGSARASDYAGREGVVYGYATAPDSVDPLLQLAITPGAWEFRTGDDWEDAVATATYAVESGDTLVVDGVELIPASFEPAGSYAGFYGEYADTVRRDIADGDFVGKWIFARDLGPVYVALGGVEYELVTYQDGLLDTGS